jgi:hypothetical protein
MMPRMLEAPRQDPGAAAVGKGEAAVEIGRNGGRRTSNQPFKRRPLIISHKRPSWRSQESEGFCPLLCSAIHSLLLWARLSAPISFVTACSSVSRFQKPAGPEPEAHSHPIGAPGPLVIAASFGAVFTLCVRPRGNPIGPSARQVPILHCCSSVVD